MQDESCVSELASSQSIMALILALLRPIPSADVEAQSDQNASVVRMSIQRLFIHMNLCSRHQFPSSPSDNLYVMPIRHTFTAGHPLDGCQVGCHMCHTTENSWSIREKGGVSTENSGSGCSRYGGRKVVV